MQSWIAKLSFHLDLNRCGYECVTSEVSKSVLYVLQFLILPRRLNVLDVEFCGAIFREAPDHRLERPLLPP